MYAVSSISAQAKRRAFAALAAKTPRRRSGGLVIAHGGGGGNAHLPALLVGVDAGAHEIELPAELRLLLDQEVELGPGVLGRGVLQPVGLDADHHLRRRFALGDRLADRFDRRIGGVDQRRRGAGLEGLVGERRDLATGLLTQILSRLIESNWRNENSIPPPFFLSVSR